jgi:hypothetical protein
MGPDLDFDFAKKEPAGEELDMFSPDKIITADLSLWDASKNNEGLRHYILTSDATMPLAADKRKNHACS